MGAVEAVFRSLDNFPITSIVVTTISLVHEYELLSVQMKWLFGSMGDNCGYWRCALPVIRQQAKRAFMGEFLVNAQGEDVVAGVRYSHADC